LRKPLVDVRTPPTSQPRSVALTLLASILHGRNRHGVRPDIGLRIIPNRIVFKMR
jgi:hypothetical protein